MGLIIMKNKIGARFKYRHCSWAKYKLLILLQAGVTDLNLWLKGAHSRSLGLWANQKTTNSPVILGASIHSIFQLPKQASSVISKARAKIQKEWAKNSWRAYRLSIFTMVKSLNCWHQLSRRRFQVIWTRLHVHHQPCPITKSWELKKLSNSGRKKGSKEIICEKL